MSKDRAKVEGDGSPVNLIGNTRAGRGRRVTRRGHRPPHSSGDTL